MTPHTVLCDGAKGSSSIPFSTLRISHLRPKIGCFGAPTAQEIKAKLIVRNAPLARVTSIYIFAIHKAGSKIRRYNKIETSGNQSSIGTFDNTTTYVKSPAGRKFWYMLSSGSSGWPIWNPSPNPVWRGVGGVRAGLFGFSVDFMPGLFGLSYVMGV